MEIISKINVNGVDYSLAGNNGFVKSYTYAELKSLVQSNLLEIGTKYRITDYNFVNTEYKSANHQFDIIVTAKTNNSFYANAEAIHHEGDEYFINSDLSKWKLLYAFDNSVIQQVGYDEINSKGFIYQMIDEFNNYAEYDFKNCLFTLTADTFINISEEKDFYTFSIFENNIIKDFSLEFHCSNNKIINTMYATKTSTAIYINVICVKKTLTNAPIVKNNIILSNAHDTKIYSEPAIGTHRIINNCFKNAYINNGREIENCVICVTKIKSVNKLTILNSNINSINIVSPFNANSIINSKIVLSNLTIFKYGYIKFNESIQDIKNVDLKSVYEKYTEDYTITITETDIDNSIIKINNVGEYNIL